MDKIEDKFYFIKLKEEFDLNKKKIEEKKEEMKKYFQPIIQKIEHKDSSDIPDKILNDTLRS